MSHYTVEFTGTTAEKEAQALNECKSWLGTKAFNNFLTINRQHNVGSRTDRLRTLYFGAGMSGMQGRTVVHALYRAIWPALPQ